MGLDKNKCKKLQGLDPPTIEATTAPAATNMWSSSRMTTSPAR
jgi:hypothetical protein